MPDAVGLFWDDLLWCDPHCVLSHLVLPAALRCRYSPFYRWEHGALEKPIHQHEVKLRSGQPESPRSATTLPHLKEGLASAGKAGGPLSLSIALKHATHVSLVALWGFWLYFSSFTSFSLESNYYVSVTNSWHTARSATRCLLHPHGQFVLQSVSTVLFEKGSLGTKCCTCVAFIMGHGPRG